MAVLAFLGIGGAILWLLVSAKALHLEVFKDRNFTGGCVMMAATGAITYASAVRSFLCLPTASGLHGRMVRPPVRREASSSPHADPHRRTLT